jgi:hypothetical protein
MNPNAKLYYKKKQNMKKKSDIFDGRSNYQSYRPTIDPRE